MALARTPLWGLCGCPGCSSLACVLAASPSRVPGGPERRCPPLLPHAPAAPSALVAEMPCTRAQLLRDRLPLHGLHRASRHFPPTLRTPPSRRPRATRLALPHPMPRRPPRSPQSQQAEDKNVGEMEVPAGPVFTVTLTLTPPPTPMAANCVPWAPEPAPGSPVCSRQRPDCLLPAGTAGTTRRQAPQPCSCAKVRRSPGQDLPPASPLDLFLVRHPRATCPGPPPPLSHPAKPHVLSQLPPSPGHLVPRSGDS